MKNLFIRRKNAGYNYCSAFATKLLALGLCLGLSYGANGQDCSMLLSGGEIRGDTTICYGGKPNLVASISSATFSSTPISPYEFTYVWEYSVNDGISWKTYVGFSVNPTNVANSQFHETTQIRRRVSDNNGCVKYSNTITVTVLPLLEITDIGDQYVCHGEKLDVPLSGAPNGVTFDWEVTDGTVFYSAAGLAGLKGSDDNKITCNNAINDDGSTKELEITVTPKFVTTDLTCTGMVQDPKAFTTFKVTVNPKPKMDPIPTAASQTVHSSGAISGVTFSSPITSPTVTYEWTATGDYSAIGLAASGTGDFAGFTAKANTSDAPYKATIKVSPKIGDCIGTETEEFTITVNPEPKMNEIPATASQPICSGGEIKGITFGTSITSSAVTYEWTATGEWSKISSKAASGTGDFPGFTAKANTSNASYVATITVTPKIGSYPTPASNQRSFAITVRPEPKMTDIPATASQTICGGGAIAGVTFGTPVTPANLVTYEWTATGDWSKISSKAASGTGDFPGFTAKTNTSNAPYIATITVTPKIGSCTGASKQFTIRVNPFAKNSDIVSRDTIICSGSTAKLTASSSIANAVYKWYSSQDATTPLYIGDKYTAPELTADTTFYVSVSGDGYCENPAGNRRAVKVKVNPLPELTSSLHDTIYSGAVFSYAAVSSIAETEFSWIRSGVADILQIGSEGATGIITDTLDNTGKQPVKAIYVITLTSPEGCTATDTVTATVYPKTDPPKIVSQSVENVTYSVCELEHSDVLEVVAETVEGATLSYQWYSNTVESVEGGDSIHGAVDSVFSIPAGLPVGVYYYYCEVRSEYSATPTYSEIVKVNIEYGEAGLTGLSVNGNRVPIQNSVLEYMAYCDDRDYVEIGIEASSQYAYITVNGVEYVPNFTVPLDADVIELKIRIVSCDELKVAEHTLYIMRALSKLIFQRWDNSLAVDLNPEYNGGYTDLRGVRWYRNDALMKEQLLENGVAVRDWIIKLDAQTELYRAEVNVAGRWHRVCGPPVRNEPVSRVYPNPVSRGENLTVELSSVTPNRLMNIISLNGSVAQRNIPLSSTVNTINVTGFDPGIYILQIIDNPEQQNTVSKTVKIIVH